MTTISRDNFKKIMEVEGLALDAEQEAMFEEFDRLKLSPEERRKRIFERYGYPGGTRVR